MFHVFLIVIPIPLCKCFYKIYSKCTKSSSRTNNIKLVTSYPTSSPSHKDPRIIFTPALPHLPEDHANLPSMEKKWEDMLNQEKDMERQHHADDNGVEDQKKKLGKKSRT